MRKVISNTSCLIALSNIKKLDILNQLYGTVYITPEVRSELGENIPDWITVASVNDQSKIKLIMETLDLGEASSIALAMEAENSLLILDDGKARRFAKNMGLTLTGTLGIVVKAKQSGIITENIADVFADFRKRGFRIPPGIEGEFS